MAVYTPSQCLHARATATTMHAKALRCTGRRCPNTPPTLPRSLPTSSTRRSGVSRSCCASMSAHWLTTRATASLMLVDCYYILCGQLIRFLCEHIHSSMIQFDTGHQYAARLASSAFGRHNTVLDSWGGLRQIATLQALHALPNNDDDAQLSRRVVSHCE